MIASPNSEEAAPALSKETPLEEKPSPSSEESNIEPHQSMIASTNPDETVNALEETAPPRSKETPLEEKPSPSSEESSIEPHQSLIASTNAEETAKALEETAPSLSKEITVEEKPSPGSEESSIEEIHSPNSEHTVTLIPEDGISIDGLQFFLQTYQTTVEKLETTQNVCSDLVKPVTKDDNCSICAQYLKDSKTEAFVGKANFFVSHAWGGNFIKLLGALCSYFEKSKDVKLWIDIFSVNQHIVGGYKNYDWWSKTFKESIARFGNTVLVLQPYSNPAALERAWCIFEIFCTIEVKANFTIALCPTDELEMIDALEKDGEKTLNLMFTEINMEEASCTFPEDKENIIRTIKELTGGFNKINHLVFTKLREWQRHVVEREREKLELSQDNEEKMSNLNEILGILYLNTSNPKLPEKYLEQCYYFRKSVYGIDDDRTLRIMELLGSFYMSTGYYQEAQTYYHTILNVRTARNVSNKLHLIIAHTNVSNAHLFSNREKARSSFNEAEDIQKKFEKSSDYKRFLQADKSAVVKSWNALAQVATKLGRYDYASHLLTLCITISEHEKNLEFLRCKNNLATVLALKGESPESREKLLEVIATLKDRYPDHPETVAAQMNLADVCINLGEDYYEEAEALFSDCLAMKECSIVEKLNVQYKYAVFKRKTGFPEEAEKYYRIYLKESNAFLGPGNSLVWNVMKELADFYISLGHAKHFGKVEELLSELLKLKTKHKGSTDYETLLAQYELGSFYAKFHEYQKAIFNLKDCLDKTVVQTSFPELEELFSKVLSTLVPICPTFDENDPYYDLMNTVSNFFTCLFKFHLTFILFSIKSLE
jgi:tetratricopeptide (TPR) repeat protein